MSVSSSARTTNEDSHAVTCKTCYDPIPAKEFIFTCISCEDTLHMRPKCTAMSAATINALIEVNLNVLLICNTCVANNRRDIILKTARQNQSRASSPEPLIEELKEIKDSLSEKITNEFTTIKTEWENLKKDLVNWKTTSTAKNTEATKPKPDKQPPPSGVRIRGIPEFKPPPNLNIENESQPSYVARDHAEYDRKEVEAILAYLKVDCEITNCRRLGKYQADKTRTIIVDIDNEWNKRLLLMSLAKLRNYHIPVYISRELTREEQHIENGLLKRRKDLIDIDKVNRKELKIQNLKLMQLDNGIWKELVAPVTQ